MVCICEVLGLYFWGFSCYGKNKRWQQLNLIPHILFLSDFITAKVSVTPLNPIHGNECGKFKLNKDDVIYNLQRNFLSKLCYEYVRNFSSKTEVKYTRFCTGLDMMYIIKYVKICVQLQYHVNLWRKGGRNPRK